jgi:hypothetical protein
VAARARDAGRSGGLLDAGDPEVQDLGPAVVGQEDVVRLDIAVDDPARVGGREAVGDLGGDVDRLLGRERPAPQSLGERFALQKLRHGPRDRAKRARIVDRKDVRVIEGGDSPRFAVETREAVGVVRRRVREHLEGNLSTEAVVSSAIELAHASPRQGSEDLVGPDLLSGFEGHVPLG